MTFHFAGKNMTERTPDHTWVDDSQLSLGKQCLCKPASKEYTRTAFYNKWKYLTGEAPIFLL